jgi:hypothetical protein
MKRVAPWLWFAVLAAPGWAVAAPTLLGGRTLTLTLLRQELPPPPPPPPSEPPARLPVQAPQEGAAPATPSGLPVSGEEAPGLGGVLGFMITGAGVAGEGLIFVLYGLLALTATGGQAAGAVLLGFGIAHLGVGGLLLYFGNNKRVERNAWNEAHGITRVEPNRAFPVLALNF